MEAFLHYLWASRRWLRLIPTGQWAGLPLEVLDPGRLNYHAGPDFLEARVRIGDLLWCGAVEIHRASAEWYRHGHQHDPAYSSVILHVVECDDHPVQYPSGEGMPTCILLVPEGLRQEEQTLVAQAHALPCASLPLPPTSLEGSPFLDCLYRLRLRRKVAQLQELLTRSEGDWAQAGYALLLRYMGFGLNNAPFELLAFRLPYHLLAKHRDDVTQLEALLIGSAGLLHVLPAGEARERLEQEYAFLAYKYGVAPLEAGVCRRARTRPANLPEYRLLQLAQLLHRTPALTSLLASAEPLPALSKRLRQPLPPAWQGGKWRGKGELTATACLSLYLNAFVPYRLAYERVYRTTTDEAWDPVELLATMPAEANRVTRLFSAVGATVSSALTSQALLELYERYCSQASCGCCPRQHEQSEPPSTD